MAGTLDLCSNYSEGTFTPDQLRNLAVQGTREQGLSTTASYRPHDLSRRLGAGQIVELVERATAGESARSLAREFDIAPSALIRLLREQGVTIQRRKVDVGTRAEIHHQLVVKNPLLLIGLEIVEVPHLRLAEDAQRKLTLDELTE